MIFSANGTNTQKNSDPLFPGRFPETVLQQPDKYVKKEPAVRKTAPIRGD